ncbi:MAG: hypothetical protein EXR75_15205 [Myxococcales bacterium]|nr:hypothetical protein [Myxococcales bacterium]
MTSPREPQLVQGVDYTMEGPNLVFTAHYLLKRGSCCNKGCRHCPYREGAELKVNVEIRGLDAVPPPKKPPPRG